MPDPGIASDHLWRLLATAAAPRASLPAPRASLHDPHVSLHARRAGAIRMACVLEATAPKVGNVHPAAHFHDLNYSHFVAAADAVAEVLSELDGADQVGAGIRSAVAASRVATGTNVNLGIVLLLAPLLACEPTWHHDRTASLEQRCSTWQSRVAELLDRLDHRQGAQIASSIAAANAGGLSEESLGEDHPLDVTGKLADSYDILAAMRLAASRDRIALQYADGYRDLLEHVVPTLGHWVASTGDLLSGIVWAHIALIAEAGDSLIGRKCGQAESGRVARLARACLRAKRDEPQHDPIASVHDLDAALRADGNRLNPGTTADLIAAALYVLLRCNTIPSSRPG